MTTTMTMPKAKKRTKTDNTDNRPAMPVTVDADLFSEPTVTASGHVAVDMTPSAKLKNECLGVRLTFNWYRTGKQVDKVSKQHMADAASSTEDGFSASKRLMDSKHPVIKKANELQRRIQGYFHSMTVPLAGFVPGRGKPEPGVRLLAIDRIEEFDSRMNTFAPEVQAIAEELNKALPDIKRMDEKRLKGLYRDEDYPADLKLDLSWGFLNVDVPAALEKLSPKVYQRETERLAARMDETYELATATVLEQFLDIVQDWTEVLGPVTRIYPTESSRQSLYHGAEIRKQLGAGTHDIRVSSDKLPGQMQTVQIKVPAGKTSLLIRHYAVTAETDRKLTELVIGPFSPAEFADLQPSQVASEKRVFKSSTIDGMTSFLSQFRNISSMISASANLKSLVKTVESHLARLSDTATVANELRNSSTFRAETHKLMTSLGENLTQEIQVFRKSCRRIDRPAT